LATITWSGTVTATSRINAADGNQTVSMTSSDEDTLVADTSNSDTVASGDKLSWAFTNDAGSGSFNVEKISSELASTLGETLMLTGGLRPSINDGLTRYTTVSGRLGANSTQSNGQHAMRFDAESSHLGCHVSQVTGGTSWTVALQIGGTDGNQSVSGSTATQTIDSSNTDTLTDGDQIDLELSSTVGGTRWRPQSTTLKLTAAAGSSNLFMPPASDGGLAGLGGLAGQSGGLAG